MSYIQSYEGANPSGNTDTMCKIYIDSPDILRFTDCIPFTGEYTIQFWIKSGTNTTVLLDANGIHRVIDTTTEWVKYIYTFTVTDDYDRSVYFSFPLGVFYLYHVKLELGHTASEWTPAPDDSESITSADTDTRLNRLSDKYTDKLGCDNGLWYIERNTQILSLDGSESWTKVNNDNNVYEFRIPKIDEAYRHSECLCDRFIKNTSSVATMPANTFKVVSTTAYSYLYIRPDESIASTLSAFKTWLGSHNTNVLLPAESTTIRLANYVQGTLNNLIAKDNLSVYITEDNVHSMRGHIVVEPIVFGTVNEDMSATITNMSDDEIGFIYEIHCKDEVTDPAIYLSETNEHIKLDGLFIMDDVITIDTRRGHKSVTKTYRGHTTNIINQFVNTSKWLQLQSGVNHLIQSAESGASNMDSRIIYTNEYEGV